MIINDPIYGKVKIESKVVIELIKSAPFQRLKKIAQYGIPDKYYFIKNITRFEHSIGVMILLKKLGASEKEQIAGLLHDISHTAFSHLIDWVIGKVGGDENFQDEQHKNFMNSKTLSKVLRKYKFNPEEIFDYKRFGLLERPIPMLCADRVDYSLREFPKTRARFCINNLLVLDNKIVFKNKKAAKLFALSYLSIQENHWGGFEAKARYFIFANLLRYALDKKIIKFGNFWKYDQYIIEKLEKSKDEKILKTLKVLKNKSLRKYKMGKLVKKKFRRVDPQFLEKNKLVTLSETDKHFFKILERAKKENALGTPIPILEYFSSV